MKLPMLNLFENCKNNLDFLKEAGQENESNE
jgi:hypothetical protein